MYNIKKQPTSKHTTLTCYKQICYHPPPPPPTHAHRVRFTGGKLEIDGRVRSKRQNPTYQKIFHISSRLQTQEQGQHAKHKVKSLHNTLQDKREGKKLPPLLYTIVTARADCEKLLQVVCRSETLGFSTVLDALSLWTLFAVFQLPFPFSV